MDIKEIVAKQPRLRLTPLPTPLEFAPNLTALLGGPRIYIKRDDLTALAFGGNKTRKLEFLLPQAAAEGADTVITLGGLQSNWVRQTVAAARKLGMEAVVVLEGEPPQGDLQGNLLLDHLMGAELRYEPNVPQDVEDLEIQGVFPITGKIAEEYRAKGRHPVLMPLGGATPVGNLGYINAVDELNDQLKELGVKADYVIAATGTGGTQAGIECGLRLSGMDTKMLGISVSYHTRPKEEEIAELCNATMDFLGCGERFAADQISVNYDYIGAGYGAVTDAALEAVSMAARTEGLILCHTYAGKALPAWWTSSARGSSPRRTPWSSSTPAAAWPTSPTRSSSNNETKNSPCLMAGGIFCETGGLSPWCR